MPILPLLVAYVAIILHRTATRPGVLGIALGLFGVSGLFAFALWQDPHAANDTALLLAKSRFADGHVYIPGLFIRTWAAGAPGLVARLAVWGLLLAGLVAWLHRAARSRGGERPLRAIVVALSLVLVAGAILERWPSRRDGPALGPSVALADGRTVFLDGPVRAQDAVYELSPGKTTLLVRVPQTPDAELPAAPSPLTLLVGGTGTVQLEGRPPVALRPQGLLLSLPLAAAAIVYDADGARETLSRHVLRVAGSPMALRLPAAPPHVREGLPEKVEPPPSGDR
jgi:hypothetical protein